MKILLVEDDPAASRLYARLLSGFGHEVLSAGDGEDAWNLLQIHEISLVVTDWMMPNLSGLDLCRRIRSANLDHYVYVILCTAKSDKAELVEGMEAGADDFLSKPIAAAEFRVRIRAGERILTLERGLAERNRQLATAYKLIEEDLQSAAWMQSNLLPARILSAEGIACRWYFRPSSYIAGDTLNFFPLGGGKVGFYVLDVSGHGVPAAMLSVTLSMVLAPAATFGSPLKRLNSATGEFEAMDPDEAIRELNRRFQTTDDRYFTMIYGVVDTGSRRLKLGQAGHPNPLLMTADGKVSVLGTGGMPVGLWPDIDFDLIDVSFGPGDRLFLYSDGVSECANSRDNMYGDDRVMKYFESSAGKPLDDVIGGLEPDLDAWRDGRDFRDDVSVMALEFTMSAELSDSTDRPMKEERT